MQTVIYVVDGQKKTVRIPAYIKDWIAMQGKHVTHAIPAGNHDQPKPENYNFELLTKLKDAGLVTPEFEGGV